MFPEFEEPIEQEKSESEGEDQEKLPPEGEEIH